MKNALVNDDTVQPKSPRNNAAKTNGKCSLLNSRVKRATIKIKIQTKKMRVLMINYKHKDSVRFVLFQLINYKHNLSFVLLQWR